VNAFIKLIMEVGIAVLLLSLITVTIGVARLRAMTSENATLPSPLRIPFKVDQTGLPTFNAEIGGKPVLLFLDFGGSKSLTLKQQVLDRLAIKYEIKTQKITLWTGVSSLVKTFTAPNFKAGTLQLSTIAGTVLPDDAYHFPQDGTLGFGFLKSFLVIFDYVNNEVRLYPGNNAKAMRDECGINVFAVDVTKGVAELTADTELGRRSFLIDTGANQDVARPGANPVLGSAGSVFTYRRFKIGAKDIGPERFLVVPYKAPDVDGVLGRSFFSRHVVCIDAAAGKAAVRQ
jgi:hypothetical protein